MSSKTKSQLWRIDFAAGNTFHVNRWKQMEGGMAFYNQHTGNILYNSRPKDWDFVQVFKNNPVPVTIINGQYDFVDFGGKQYAIWLKGITNVQLFILPDAGHNSWIDQPKLFKRDVNYGLQRALSY